MSIDFKYTPAKWDNQGAEPSENLKTNGYQPGYKPPAQVFNYLQNNTSNCLNELQSRTSNLDDIKVDKVEGKGLSTNDYTDEEKAKLGALDETISESVSNLETEITNLVNTKVDKVEGMGLSSNDYTDEEKAKLAALDETISESVSDLETEINSKANKDLSNVQNTIFAEKATEAGVGGETGKDLTGQTVTFFNDSRTEYEVTEIEVTKTAGTNAEIFNDYRDRTYSKNDSRYVFQGNVASGQWSHAEGRGTTAIGDGSHAEGYYNIASGQSSHVEGETTTASGHYSHAEGEYTTASGSHSHSEGWKTIASGEYSHAGGYDITANNYQLVHGKHNKISAGPTSHSDTSGDIFIIGNGTSSSAPTNALRTTTAGKTYGLSNFAGSGADYAEYFEWLDGNPDNEDRRGYFVTLDGDKVKKATDKDSYILGVVSATPSLEGDSQSEIWNDMYLKDVFGEKLIETIEVEEHTDENGHVIPAHTEKRWILNPEYDGSLEYENRENRKEWSPIGLIGKLIVIDDGTCQVNEYCTPNADGIATASDKGYRVMNRLDSNHVRILLK